MDDRGRGIARKLALPMLIVVVLVIPVVVIDESSVNHTWKSVGDALNWLTWTAFLFELLVLLWVAPHKTEWLRRHPLDVLIVVLTPPFIAAFAGLRLLRLLRLIRLVRLAPLARQVFSLDGLKWAALLAALTALAGGAAFAALEQGAREHPHISTWEGVYWAVTTMTTVGYGDLSPDTTGGQVIAIAVMLVGIGFVAVLTGAVAQRFLSSQVQAAEEAVEEVEDTELNVLAEIREISTRLRKLERALQEPR